MAGFATDTHITTYTVTLPDGQTVQITDESDGSGNEPEARAVLFMDGAPNAQLTCHVSRSTLVDGIDDEETCESCGEDLHPGLDCPKH